MKYLKNNLALKLFSVGLALLLWLIVFNVSNPEQKGSRTVELKILNQDAFSADNKTWEIDRNTVTVSYTVRSNMSSSVQASDFNAYIDLNDYSITGSVPVYVELKNSENSGIIQDIVAKPSVVRVNVEDLQIKKFTLTTNRRGKEKEGYVVSSIHAEPETIYATGPESSIGRISSIGILINVDGLSENTGGKEKPVFYDANGKTIDSLENVSLSQSEIDYTIVVNKKKNLKIISSSTGTLPNAYTLSGLEISPSTVTVSGNESLLESITSISLPAIDISSATGDVIKEYSIADYLPKGISLAEPNGTVTLTAKIQKNEETTKESTEREESESASEEPKAESTAEGSTEESKESKETKAGEETRQSNAKTEKKTTEESQSTSPEN